MGKPRARRCVSNFSLLGTWCCLRCLPTRDMPDHHNGADVQWRGTVLPLNGTNTLNSEDANSISSVIAEPDQASKSTSTVVAELDQASGRKPRKSKVAAIAQISRKMAIVPASADAKKAKKEQSRINRASRLRKDYPNMQNIPKSITPSQRKKLILEHTQNAANRLQPTHPVVLKDPKGVVPTSAVQSKKISTGAKQMDRANELKRQYPDMEGIPLRIGKGTRKTLIAQYNARSTAKAPSLVDRMPSNPRASSGPRMNELPTRSGPPVPPSGLSVTPQNTPI